MNTTLPAASSATTAWPSGVAADRVPPSPVTMRLDLVRRRDRQQLLAGRASTRPSTLVDDQRPALDGVHGDVLADAHAGRVGDPLDGVVDDRDDTGRAVVDDDDPRRLVDVEVGPRVGDADGGSHLAHEPVDVTHVPRVALQQPRPAVVGVGLRALAALGLQRRDDDGRR